MADTVTAKRCADREEILANPGGAGLALLGMTLVLFALVEANLFKMPVRTFGLLLLLAGVLHLAVGVNELRRQNGFGATACFGYGFFWLSLIALFVYPQLNHGHAASDSMQACYLIMWAFFTGVLFLGTLRLSRTLRLAFVLLAVFQLCFAAGLAMHLQALQLVSGYLGVLCGLLFVVLAGVKLLSVRRSSPVLAAVGRKTG